ncbi:MAG: hypothetical protein VX265_08350 [Myxococcota bacterium]|nr:hypothetical protein [Myxococcota bacterium]
MDATQLILYLTVLAVVGPALIYLATPRHVVLSVREMNAMK